MRTIGIIPARLQSSRLARKLLLAATGKPLLQYAWEAACRAKELSEVIIATDSEEIATVSRGFGARVEMTGEHPSGTDRIAEVVRRACPDAELIVNVQGDEPDLNPENINKLVRLIAGQPGVEMATLATPFMTAADFVNPNQVKVVLAPGAQQALYFSRSPIPYARDLGGRVDDAWVRANPCFRHLGLYAYKAALLQKFASLPLGRLEQIEKLEQLRVLENGYTIACGLTEDPTIGVDTPDDADKFERWLG